MRLRYLATAALFAAAPLFGASAEPQILGLLAQNEAIPLNCTGGECFAEFSSFCMEPDRSAPSHATRYYPTEDADLTLVATASNGEEVRLPATDLARFINVRGYASVRVSVPETMLAELGATRLALAVGRRVSLLPEALPDARRPHEPEEIALTTGVRRVVGEEIVDDGGPRADAARLVTRLLNALPEEGRVSDEVRDGLWQSAIEGAAIPWSGAKQIARTTYEVCRSRDPVETRFTLRQCIESRHDRLIWSLNRTYWASVGGS